MKAEEMVRQLALTKLPEMVESMSEREKDNLRKQLEFMSMRSAQIAAYIDCRQNHGASDQGHDKAVKNVNRVSKLLWTKGFEYNDWHKISF